jgi:nucleoside phosphorylase/CheY-like chemotaxis protein
MKILVLEDDLEKMTTVFAQIKSVDSNSEVEVVSNFLDYTKKIILFKFDLIIADLVVPSFPGEISAQDMTKLIIENTRDVDCQNYRTPVIALTSYDNKAEEQFKDLNSRDITVITYDLDGNWRASLNEKILGCVPPIKFDFVIICALSKEAAAYQQIGCATSDPKIVYGLTCQEIVIDDMLGVIVTCPRMGLVSAAITATQAIDLFEPQLICMSGICAGVPGRAKIYDIVIPESCHQNDSGKWNATSFESEPYSVQLEHSVKTHLAQFISSSSFADSIKAGISLQKSEFPEDRDDFSFDVFLAPASSGSSVIANREMVDSITGQHRKLSAFEMESFAIYEAARLSIKQPRYFSAKSVVDDGSPSKGDAYHRVACLISAKTVFECIKSAVWKK